MRSAVLQRPFGEAREEGRMRDNALELLAFFGLADKHDAKATDLPYGDQRKLEMARALATQPRLLLLDEPAAGMNPHETQELDELITRIRDRGVTIVLVEHDMRLVMDISDRITVLNFGTKIADGAPARDPAQPGRDRGLSRRGRAAMTHADDRRACAPATARSRCCTTSRSRSTQGQIVTLIGANGAGKTTLLKTISGLIRPAAGTIEFEGESIVRRPAHKIVARGLSHVPEGRAILKRMTVLDNLRMGAYVRSDAEVDRDIDAVFARFPVLAERRDQMAGDALRRRAADAGDRPRAGGAPAAAAARRAVARPRAEIRHADFPHAARAEAGGQDHPSGRAECPPGAAGCRSRLRHGARPDRAQRARAQELLNMPEVRRTYLGQSAA